MRAFIYGRFSSHKQQELSIEAQIDICREYAEKHSITVVGEYVDRARSARTENRADFRRLIRDACTGVVDCVLVWRYDRFFRDRAESALYRKQLEAAGVHLISVTEFIPDCSAGVITQGMIETVAEYFSAKLSEDVTRGMNKAAQHCQITGGAPLGYRPGPNKRWQIDPVGAELVKRCFEWYDSGKSMGELADHFNKEGHKTAKGNSFNKSSFTTILRNKKYIGIYEYDGTVSIAGGVPRIIEDDLFFRVQRKLDANRHRPGAYKAEVPYLLSGKLFCGKCGSPMTGTAGTGKSGVRHYYYICNNRRAKKCDKKNVRLDLIEDAVLQSALGVLTNENIAYISAEVERRCSENSGNKALISSLRAQLAEVEKQLKNIGNAIAQGIITETTKQMLMEAEADRAALRQHGLRIVVRREVAAVLDILVQPLSLAFDLDQLKAEGARRYHLCQIVACRAKAARGDDYIRALLCNLDAAFKPFGVVAHDRVIAHVYSYLRQQLGYIARIGIRHMSQQQLRPDGDYFSIIASRHFIPPSLSLCLLRPPRPAHPRPARSPPPPPRAASALCAGAAV